MQALSIVGTVPRSAHKESLVDTSGALVAVRVQYRFEARAALAAPTALAGEPALSGSLRLVEPPLASRSVGVGPASLRGLAWLARVGPAPAAAWACAMGWVERVARRHAERLEAHGWVKRCAMTSGAGPLVVVTRAGAWMTGLELRPASVPGPTWRAHWRGCAWTAAWLECRGREWLGSARYSGSSTGGDGLGGATVAVDRWPGTDQTWSPAGRRGPGGNGTQVRLAHGRCDEDVRGWVAARRIPGVMYVVGSEQARERVVTIAGAHELKVRIELLRRSPVGEPAGLVAR
jgi:hypothetical protein